MSRPVLLTERVRLEPLTAAHTELLVELDSDPEVLRLIHGRALSRDEVVGTYMPRRTAPQADARGLGFWIGWDRHDPERWFGWWCLIPDADRRGSAELGYRLRRTAWGRDLATEGGRVLVDHAFGTVGLQRVWAETMAVNTASRAVLRKLGLNERAIRVDDEKQAIPGWEHGVVSLDLDRSAAGPSRVPDDAQ
ncbi:GNAT family N-acetyltransferase [Nocardioides sp. AX2bis]|uniref:GNAT family N-acetyltransferase n=1 Tax=Nocardioides sp. AX2bis TaxID=2653157 RepID=UPI0012F18076|nr:GNAT family N-acetyltransferase [Nocardioides sp. AX2bis]VXC14412.1 Protein N-acetyltransferase, RimJ/RimL family [Nocardioides sp. AX2bis]